MTAGVGSLTVPWLKRFGNRLTRVTRLNGIIHRTDSRTLFLNLGVLPLLFELQDQGATQGPVETCRQLL